MQEENLNRKIVKVQIISSVIQGSQKISFELQLTL